MSIKCNMLKKKVYFFSWGTLIFLQHCTFFAFVMADVM